MPARSAARFAASFSSARFQDSRSAASSASRGSPASAPATPSATMLVQQPGTAFAIFLNGCGAYRAPDAV